MGAIRPLEAVEGGVDALWLAAELY